MRSISMLKSTVQSYEDYLILQGVGIKKARPVKGRAKCLKVNWSKNLCAKVGIKTLSAYTSLNSPLPHSAFCQPATKSTRNKTRLSMWLP